MRNIGIIKLFFLLMLLVLSTFPVIAQISIEKSAPNEIMLGEILEVRISIENEYNKNIQLEVIELIGDAEPIDPPQFAEMELPSECKFCAFPPFFKWDLDIKAKEIKEILYKIKPSSIGDYSFSATKVTTKGGDTFYSNILTTSIDSPQNSICEPEEGETYFNNPEDCPSGSADGVCDLVKDNKCDPDCKEGADTDCLCGNGVCDPNEDYHLCDKDCTKPTQIQIGTKTVKKTTNYTMIIIILILLIIIPIIMKISITKTVNEDGTKIVEIGFKKR